jgi:hypothetical protein
MVKIARLDEEAAILKEQATVEEQVAGMGDAAFVHQVEISPCTVIMGNILGRKIESKCKEYKDQSVNAI